MSKPFKFKQFAIHQGRCAMKVGTDGVLLGSWASLAHSPNAILDIGAGTGLIALMLAQRSGAETLDAIEIEASAFEQCVENFEASSWADRLFCYHAGLDEFVAECDQEYDLIVSNPPFYSEEVSSGDPARDVARQNIALPFDKLLAGVSKLLSEKGVFTAIIPFNEEKCFINLAVKTKLFPRKITRVKGNFTTKIKRSLLEFSFQKGDINSDELVIEIERHNYTKEYIDLTKDFYLKM